MVYLLKNLLLLILVIFKLKCNNLIFNEIIVLNASYVCLHAFSLRRVSPDLDPGRRTPHFWGVLSHTPCRRKSDQHATRFPCSIRVGSRTIHLSWSTRATFRYSLRCWNMPLHLKEVLATKDRLTRPSPWVASFFLPHDSLGVGERCFDQVVTHLLQLTGLISPVCDRYI
jgi:hypothetical protein